MADAPDDWAVSTVLADGETAFVRPITSNDAPLLLAFHERQPRENQYLRFFSAKPTLTTAELTHFTEVDHHDRVALLMELRGELIAWASYERWSGRDDADVAFMVDEGQHGRGIATLLLEHLAAIARSNGIERFTAEVLFENKPMLRVFARAGWPVERHYESAVVELQFPLIESAAFIDSMEQREHQADSAAMARLLLPRSLAVIGGSDRPGSVGFELWRNASAAGSAIAFAVNPNHASVGGTRSYASVMDIADDVWLALIAVDPRDLESTIDQCIAKHVRGAIVFTAVDGATIGAADVGDAGIDVAALVERARRSGLRIIGPASMGVASSRPSGALNASLVDVRLPAGGVAISMQSGSLGASLLELAGEMSIGISWFVSLGDKSDVSGNDLMQFWEDDEQTRVIAMYTETYGNPRKFARIARRVGRRRPIVTVRAGAAATGSARRALARQAGLIEAPTVRAMLDTARVLATQPIPNGSRVTVLTNSRSPGVLAASALRAAGLDVVPPPVELSWRSSHADFELAIRAAIADDSIDVVMVIHAPPTRSTPAPIAAIDAAASGSPKPIVAVTLGGRDGPLGRGSAVPAFSFPESAAAVLGRIDVYARWLRTEASAPDDGLAPADAAAVDAVLRESLARQETVLSYADTQRVLEAYDLDMAPGVALTDVGDDEVVAAAGTLGHPVTLKAGRRRIGRSVAAGIALDLATGDAVAESLAVMRGSLGPDAATVVVQQMVPPGLDVHIHAAADPELGAVVTVGPGSQQIGHDRGTGRLAPISAAAASAMVHDSPVAAALDAAGFDDAQLITAIRRVAAMIAEHQEIVEIDVDPAIVSAGRVAITDAWIAIRTTDRAVHVVRSL